MSPLTAFLSKLIGVYCLLVSIALATQRQAAIDSISALVHNPPLLFVFGIIWLVAGAALVVGHTVWSGGAPSIVVTLVGWITLIRALLLLLLAPTTLANLIAALHVADYFYVYMAIAFALGLYLAYAGFRATPMASGRR